MVYRQFVENYLQIRSENMEVLSLEYFMHYYNNSLLIAWKCVSYPYSHYAIQLCLPTSKPAVNADAIPWMQKFKCTHTLTLTHQHDYVTGDECSLLIIFHARNFVTIMIGRNVITTIKSKFIYSCYICTEQILIAVLYETRSSVVHIPKTLW